MKGNKEGFKRVTVSQMKAKKEAHEIATKLDKRVQEIDDLVFEEQNNLIKELGYVVPSYKDHNEVVALNNQMKADGFSIGVHQHQEGNNLVVELTITQVARKMIFDLGGDD